MKIIPLSEFPFVRVWFVSAAAPMGIMVPGEFDEIDKEQPDYLPDSWYKLNGWVNDYKWTWDGKGNPTDWQGNDLRMLSAYKD